MARNVRVVTGPRATGQVERAQEMADALAARSLRSRNPEQPWPVATAMSPWEGVAQLGEALVGAKSQQYARRLAEAQEAGQRAANERMIRDLAGERTPTRLTEQGAPIPNSFRPPEDLDTGQPMLISDKAERLAAAMQGMDPAQANQVLSGAVLSRELVAPRVERVDLGDSIGVFDESGRVVARIPKGATPDALLREQGANTRHATASGSARLGAQVSMRGQDVGAATARRGQDVTMRGQDLSYDSALRGQQAAAERAAGQQATVQAEKDRAVQQVWDTYQTARDGLLAGLAASRTGPIVGRLPALTAEQQTAEGGVAAMAPVLKQLFRVAGEGVFTDRDQQLLLDMVPKRADRPEAIAAKIANIDAIVRAKLGAPAEASAAPGAPPGEPDVESYYGD